MENKVLYVPILKSKRGEFNSLFELDPSIKSHIKPVITLTKEKADSRGLSLAKNIEQKWGSNPVYIDLNEPSNVVIQGVNHIDYILRDCSNKNLIYHPIIDIHDPNLLIINHVLQHRLQCCIKINIQLFDNTTILSLQNLINQLTNDDCIVDILIDFRSSIKSNEKAQAHHIQTFYDYIFNNFVDSVNQIIIAGSSAPKELLRNDYNPYGLAPRMHWLGFKEFSQGLPQESKHPIFSDYSVVYPDEMEPVTYVNPNAKIKYTLSDDYLFAVGYQVNTHVDGFNQYHDISRIIVNSPHYLGATYSWGDNYLSECANRTASCGNMETWVKVGHNHHITFVARQNANHYGISI